MVSALEMAIDMDSDKETHHQTLLKLYVSDEPIYPDESETMSPFDSEDMGDTDSEQDLTHLWIDRYTPLFPTPELSASPIQTEVANTMSKFSLAEYPITVSNVDLTPFYIHDVLTKKMVRNMSMMDRYLFAGQPTLCYSIKQQWRQGTELGVEGLTLDHNQQTTLKAKKTTTTTTVIEFADSNAGKLNLECRYRCIHECCHVSADDIAISTERVIIEHKEGRISMEGSVNEYGGPNKERKTHSDDSNVSWMKKASATESASRVVVVGQAERAWTVKAEVGEVEFAVSLDEVGHPCPNSALAGLRLPGIKALGVEEATQGALAVVQGSVEAIEKLHWSADIGVGLP